MPPSNRPEWTRASAGIPVDTVVRIHGGTAGDNSSCPPSYCSMHKKPYRDAIAAARRCTAGHTDIQEPCLSRQARISAAQTVSSCAAVPYHLHKSSPAPNASGAYITGLVQQTATTTCNLPAHWLFGLLWQCSCSCCLAVAVLCTDQCGLHVLYRREDEYDVTFVYGAEAGNSDIHARSLSPLIRKFIEGYNVCVLLFGATGAQQQTQQHGTSGTWQGTAVTVGCTLHDVAGCSRADTCLITMCSLGLHRKQQQSRGPLLS